MFDCVMSRYRDEIMRDLGDLVAIESVAEPDCKAQGYPFGRKSAQAIGFMLSLAESMGLSTENCGNYACHAQLGEGGDDYAAVLSHVDVVPVGDGWSTEPLTLTEKDGYLYGRGVADDKGAAIISLYCLKAMKDNGVKLKRPIRCIFGGGEEIGMDDMAHYFSKHPLPAFAFTPDADYPACNCEKGILHLRLSGKSAPAIREISGGTAINCVADSCRAVLECDVKIAERICTRVAELGATCKFKCDENTVIFETKGVSAHAMCPEKGVNAVDTFLIAAAESGILNDDSAEKFFAERICGGLCGEKIGVDCCDDISGGLTMNVGTLSKNGNEISLGVDIRYPASLDSGGIIETMTQEAEKFGVKLEITGDNKPLFVPENHPLIIALGECYTEITGKPMKPVSMGGGTYARALGGRGVAFGPVFPDARPSNLHMPDENLSLNEFMLHAEICYRAMCRLAQLDGQ